MPKLTAKYRTARELGDRLEITPGLQAAALYRALADAGHAWDSQAQAWTPMRAPIPPSHVIRLRVWADGAVVEGLADEVVRLLDTIGLECAERSPVFPCRPPQQLEGRVYLLFTRKAAQG